MPVFGFLELALAGSIALWCRSIPAFIGCVALIATMALRGVPVEFPPYATAIWAIAGSALIMRGDYLIGWLYGLSGVCYLLAYTGLQDTRYAIMHFMSDIIFILGLGIIFWPKARAAFGGSGRRGFSGGGNEKVAVHSGGNSKADWG